MSGTGSRMTLAGIGLAAACAVICCSAPLLVVVLPGLALLIGGMAESIEVGLVAAVAVGALAGVSVLVLRRRFGNCSKGWPVLGQLGASCSDPQSCVTCGGRVLRPARFANLNELPIVAPIHAVQPHPSASPATRDSDREIEDRSVSPHSRTPARTGA